MHIHILGVCGTFMGGIAAIAKAAGHRVSGADYQAYPPMSDTLRGLGIELFDGYAVEQLSPRPDLVIIGNALSRGNPVVEAVLNQRIPYTSGAQWLAETVLYNRHVIAVSGTHGKTTTTAILTHILRESGLNPGYLVGGVAHGFDSTAWLGDDYFVIEADEYDTAFFDKRSKFLHYRPQTLIINNIEFDHADIFDDINAIKRSFHLLCRTVPGEGAIIFQPQDQHTRAVIEAGCWSNTVHLNAADGWLASLTVEDGSAFELIYQGVHLATVSWSLIGQHNVANALAAVAASVRIGVDVSTAARALTTFAGVKRRLEQRGVCGGITVYDDFAHHPTAIESTLKGLRAHVGDARVIAVLELGSNTMKLGLHGERIRQALVEADYAVLLDADNVDMAAICASSDTVTHAATTDAIVETLGQFCQPGDHVLVMSNKGFNGIHDKLLTRFLSDA